MINDGKQYLIIKKQENNCYPIKLAYWFDKRVTKYNVYEEGFYPTGHFHFPHKNVIKYVDMDKLPKFTEWKMEAPIKNERYLVYRVSETNACSTGSHYTIRRYHNGSFGSEDVKYWIKLSSLIDYLEKNRLWRKK